MPHESKESIVKTGSVDSLNETLIWHGTTVQVFLAKYAGAPASLGWPVNTRWLIHRWTDEPLPEAPSP